MPGFEPGSFRYEVDSIPMCYCASNVCIFDFLEAFDVSLLRFLHLFDVDLLGFFNLATFVQIFLAALELDLDEMKP